MTLWLRANCKDGGEVYSGGGGVEIQSRALDKEDIRWSGGNGSVVDGNCSTAGGKSVRAYNNSTTRWEKGDGNCGRANCQRRWLIGGLIGQRSGGCQCGAAKMQVVGRINRNGYARDGNGSAAGAEGLRCYNHTVAAWKKGYGNCGRANYGMHWVVRWVIGNLRPRFLQGECCTQSILRLSVVWVCRILNGWITCIE